MVSMKLCTESDNFISFHKCHGNIDKTDYNKGLHLHLQRIHIQQREKNFVAQKSEATRNRRKRGTARACAREAAAASSISADGELLQPATGFDDDNHGG
jgi:hypothetical protein